MAEHQHLDVSEVDDVTIVRFVDRKILDATNIEELGDQLFDLITNGRHKKLLLSFEGVEFLSSAALNKLIILDKKAKTVGGRVKLSDLRPEIREVFVITRLTQLFEICDDQEAALEAFRD